MSSKRRPDGFDVPGSHLPIVVGEDGLYLDMARLRGWNTADEHAITERWTASSRAGRAVALRAKLRDPEAYGVEDLGDLGYDLDALDEALSRDAAVVAREVRIVGDGNGLYVHSGTTTEAEADEGRRIVEEMMTPGMLGSLGGAFDLEGGNLFGPAEAVGRKIEEAEQEGEAKAGGSLAGLLAKALATALWPEGRPLYERPAPTQWLGAVVPTVTGTFGEDGLIRLALEEMPARVLLAKLMDADVVRPERFSPGPHSIPTERPWPSNHAPGGYWIGESHGMARFGATTDHRAWRLSKWREAWRDPNRKMPRRLLSEQPPLTYFFMDPELPERKEGQTEAFDERSRRDTVSRLGRGRFVRRGDQDWRQAGFDAATARVNEDGTAIFDDELFDVAFYAPKAESAEAEVDLFPEADADA